MKRFIQLFIFLSCLSDFALSQNGMNQFTLKADAGSIITTYDSNYLVTTSGSTSIIKVDANLNIKFDLGIRCSKGLYMTALGAKDTNTYISGAVYDVNSPDSYLYLAKLNSCYEPEWTKLFLYNEIFDDTAFISTSPYITNVDVDASNNSYIVVMQEDAKIRYDSLEPHMTCYLYKFNSNGNLVFRKKIIDDKHNNLNIKTIWIDEDLIYFGGRAYFPFSKEQPYYVWLRSLVGAIDTSGNLRYYKNYSNDTFYTSFFNHLTLNKKTKRILSGIEGERHDIKSRESQLILYDSSLNEIKRIVYSEKDSNYYYSYASISTDDGSFWVFQLMEHPYENPDLYKRTKYGYLYRFDNDLNLIDSFYIDFLKYEKPKDTWFNIFNLLINTQNTSSFLLFGRKKVKPGALYSFAANITNEGKLDTTIYPVSVSDPLCQYPVVSGTRFLNFSDTIVINTYYHRNYKNIPNGIIEVNCNEEKVTIFPIPAQNEIRVQSAVPVISYSILSVSGQIIVDNENVLTEQVIFTGYLNDGNYLLKLNLQNNQTVIKKLIIRN